MGISVYGVGKTTEVNEITQGECRLRGKQAVEHNHIRMDQDIS